MTCDGDKRTLCLDDKRISWPDHIQLLKVFYLRRVTRGVPGWWPASGTGHHPRGQRCTEQEGRWRCLLILCWSFLKPFLKLRENQYTNNSIAQWSIYENWRLSGDYERSGKTWLLFYIFFIISPNRILHNSNLESRTFFECSFSIEKS